MRDEIVLCTRCCSLPLLLMSSSTTFCVSALLVLPPSPPLPPPPHSDDDSCFFFFSLRESVYRRTAGWCCLLFFAQYFFFFLIFFSFLVYIFSCEPSRARYFLLFSLVHTEKKYFLWYFFSVCFYVQRALHQFYTGIASDSYRASVIHVYVALSVVFFSLLLCFDTKISSLFFPDA